MHFTGMTMAKTLYLHIGMPKCASTTLQASLLENADALREAGKFYAKSPGDKADEPSNASQLALNLFAEKMAPVRQAVDCLGRPGWDFAQRHRFADEDLWKIRIWDTTANAIVADFGPSDASYAITATNNLTDFTVVWSAVTVPSLPGTTFTVTVDARATGESSRSTRCGPLTPATCPASRSGSTSAAASA